VCERTTEDIIHIYSENVFSNAVFVLLANMDVLVFGVKHGK
jgi:hypothetical protein